MAKWKEKIVKYLTEKSKNIHPENECWISDSEDESCSYCHVCAQKECNPGQSVVCNQYATEHDNLLFCEKCNKRLKTLLTEFGALQELDHFTYNTLNIKNENECYDFLVLVQSIDWDKDFFKNEYDYKYFMVLCKQILKEIENVKNSNKS
jgi:hypothetical protein